MQIAEEIEIIEHKAVMHRHCNGTAECEKHGAQQQGWNHWKISIHNDQLTEYDSLQEEVKTA